MDQPALPADVLRARCGAVVIGRNEAGRLHDCLKSVIEGQGLDASKIVYVDSQSTDRSCMIARQSGVVVIELDSAKPLTAARARNAGFAALTAKFPDLAYIQFVDGDCVLTSGWCSAGVAHLEAAASSAVVCGVLREQHPEQSIYNRLCDIEWGAQPGETAACGGIALMRVRAVQEVSGFRDDLAGGEEPELCLRLREQGWKIYRLDRAMATHDAAMTSFRQWWSRMVRNGTSFIQVLILHRTSPHRIWDKETASAIFWGGALPAAIAAVSLTYPPAALALLLYPLQIARIAASKGPRQRFWWRYGFFMVAGKFAEFTGILRFVLGR